MLIADLQVCVDNAGWYVVLIKQLVHCARLVGVRTSRRSSKPGTLGIMRATELYGRNTRKLKGQDPERPSNLAFESTKDSNVPHRPGKYKARNVKPKNLRAKTELRIRKIISLGARK
jgi:hypothetical protein